MSSSEKEGAAVGQIVRCIQTIIEEASSNEFKQKCLDIVGVDDFEKFNKKTTRKLRKLLKHRKKNKNMKENNVDTRSADSQSQKVAYSPIRKRYRKEPLQELPLSKNIAKNSNKNKPSNNEETEVCPSQRSEVTSKSKMLSMSPSCVDVTKLCDLINGADENIDEWLSTEEPLRNVTTSCEKDPRKLELEQKKIHSTVIPIEERLYTQKVQVKTSWKFEEKYIDRALFMEEEKLYANSFEKVELREFKEIKHKIQNTTPLMEEINNNELDLLNGESVKLGNHDEANVDGELNRNNEEKSVIELLENEVTILEPCNVMYETDQDIKSKSSNDKISPKESPLKHNIADIINPKESLKLSCESDWLEEFKQDDFWGALASSPLISNSQNEAVEKDDVFELDAIELFKIDNFQLEE